MHVAKKDSVPYKEKKSQLPMRLFRSPSLHKLYVLGDVGIKVDWHKEQLLKALCLAAVFEGPDRARALIHKALKCADFKQLDIDETLKSIENVFKDYEESFNQLPAEYKKVDHKREEADPVYRGRKNLELLKNSRKLENKNQYG